MRTDARGTETSQASSPIIDRTIKLLSTRRRDRKSPIVRLHPCNMCNPNKPFVFLIPRETSHIYVRDIFAYIRVSVSYQYWVLENYSCTIFYIIVLLSYFCNTQNFKCLIQKKSVQKEELLGGTLMLLAYPGLCPTLLPLQSLFSPQLPKRPQRLRP